MRLAIAMLMLCLALPARAQAPEQIVGHAVVKDGDSLLVAGREVRLQGIDAPEISQLCEDEAGEKWRCGGDAGRALDALIGGRTVACTIDPRDPSDRYGRTLAMCAADATALNLAMLRQGWAIAYRRYLYYRDGTPREHKPAFLAAEAEARAARRGIWRGRFDEPELWRRARPRGGSGRDGRP